MATRKKTGKGKRIPPPRKKGRKTRQSDKPSRETPKRNPQKPNKHNGKAGDPYIRRSKAKPKRKPVVPKLKKPRGIRPRIR
jgi:hypothetical protein